MVLRLVSALRVARGRVEIEDPRGQREAEGGVELADLGARWGGLAEQPGWTGDPADVQTLQLMPRPLEQWGNGDVPATSATVRDHTMDDGGGMFVQHTGRGKGDQWSTAGDVLWVVAVAISTAALSVWVCLRIPAPERYIVAVLAAVFSVALSAAIGMALHHRRAARWAQRRLAEHDSELMQAVDETVPDVARQLRAGTPLETVIAEGQQEGGPRGHLAQAVAREIAAGERRRAAVVAACASAAGRVQAMATRMLADLREMEDRYSEDVLGDLLRLDHATAQTGRMADNIAVLTGARSGRRWTRPIAMESVLRGAMSRIGAYERVRLHSASRAAVVGYAAEDVMHALAELMDNATRFSAPSEEVHVYVEELYTGVVVTIEDGGLGMKPRALQRAEALVSADEPVDLATLSGTRLGLVVVGALARKHRLHVFFRPSSRGGTGIVVRIPNQLIAPPRELVPPVVEQPLVSDPALVSVGAPAGAETAAELPKRPPGRTLAASRAAAHLGGASSAEDAGPQAGPAGPVPSPVPRPRSDLAARFQAFQQAKVQQVKVQQDDDGGPDGVTAPPSELGITGEREDGQR